MHTGGLVLVPCNLPGWEHLPTPPKQQILQSGPPSLESWSFHVHCTPLSPGQLNSAVRSQLPFISQDPLSALVSFDFFLLPTALAHPALETGSWVVFHILLPWGLPQITALPKGTSVSNEVTLVGHCPRKLLANYLLSPPPSLHPSLLKPLKLSLQHSSHHLFTQTLILKDPQCSTPTPLIFPLLPLLPLVS